MTLRIDQPPAPHDSWMPQSSDLALAAGLLAVLAVLAPLFPQLVHPGFAFFFRSTLFLLLGLWGYRLGVAEVARRLVVSPLFWPALLLFLLLLAGLFYTPNVYRAKAKLSLLLAAGLLYGTAYLWPRDDQARRWVCGGLLLGGCLAALHALITQWLGHGALIETIKTNPLYPADMREEMIRSLQANRALGRFGNPNHLAGYLALCVWPLWILWKARGPRWQRILLLGAAALLAWGIYRTYSRSGLIALAATVALTTGYELHRRGVRFSWKSALGAAVGLLILAAGFFTLLPVHWLGGRLMTVSTIVARVHFFRGGVAIIRDHPWLGVGPEGFEGFYCAYLRPGDLESRYVHNVLLEMGVEGGIAGVWLFFWLLLVTIHCLRGAQRPAKNDAPYPFAARGAVLTFLLLSLVDFHNNLMEMWLVPAFLAGIATARHIPSDAPPPNEWRTLGQAAKGASALFAAGLVAVWIILVLLRFWNETYKGNAYFLALDGQKPAAQAAYERAVFFDRTDAESWNHLGYLWADTPGPAAVFERLACLKQSVRWSPRSAAYRADYADALFAAGHTGPALEQLQTAQLLFPSRPIYHERLARYYRLLGRDAEATELEQKAQHLKELIEAHRI
ncbi:MAG: O-antigen ligase family protein [bacterium]